MKNTKNTKQKADNREVAIRVDNVHKSFKIPHERHNSLKSTALNLFKKKTFTEHHAAKGISFDVKRGEFLGIIGRNGCGKSTMLKMLAGIYVPDKGKITINGRLSPFLELGVGFNPELTARDNVYLNGAMLGLTRKEIDEKFDEIIGFAELEEFVDQKLKNFSSGMQVRLAFSVAIQAHADILLIDEVLAVGDENFQRKCLDQFNNFKNEGKTVVFVSHMMEMVKTYCDRCILIEGAEIVNEGNPETVTLEYEKLNMIGKVELGGEASEKSQIKIVDVRVVGPNNSNVIKTGDSLDVIISYKILSKKLTDKLNFAVGIHAQSGGHVLAYSTAADGAQVDLDKKSIKLRFETLPLLDGYYDVNVNCYRENEADSLDFGYKIANFKVSNMHKKHKGLLSVEHKWESSNE